MKLIKIFLLLCLLNFMLYADDLIESQPEIIFQFQKLQKRNEELYAQVNAMV